MTATEQFNYGRISSDEAEELRRLAGVIRTGVKDLTRTGVAIGEAFLSAKAYLDHGAFLNWCRLEAGFGPRKVQLYMNLAGLFRRRGEDVCLLELSAALDLAAPSVGEEIVTEILSRARRGERLTVEFVKEFIRRAKSKHGELVSNRASEMTDMIADALDVDKCVLLQEFLEKKPSVQRFVTELGESLAKKLRKNSASRTVPMLLSLPAS